MKRDIKTRWVNALTDGSYEQTTKVLRREVDGERHTYCCLGVLCDLYAKERQTDFWAPDLQLDTSALPAEVMLWADLELYPKASYEGTTEALAQLNDRGVGFPVIAKLIEDQL